ncbi:probable E3 ubiquitin-protein ligase TRIML1 [Monodelphis domestica]|uniref:probable E3 ubiquitin-protein ligase TRIML1 n=1 Tax=Monodelphis domestica TaxID=13616 RepID=UPI0024E213AE|nr:probable E3 ubiquitin-protein ligase TRIML1 [Monodelphis domestica]
MDARNLIENLKADLTCSICLGYFTDPVIVKCGHSFCRVCLLRCREEADATLNCPECRRVIEDSDVVPNRKLENLCTTGKRLRPHLLESMVDLYVCDHHGEKEKLFCEEDQRLLCASCLLAPGHKDHTVLPLEMAAHKCKDKIKHTLNTLQQKEEEYNVALDRVRRRGRLCKKDLYTLKVSVKVEYQKLHDFLWEEEELYLETLDQQYKNNLEKLELNKAKLSQQIQNLERMKLELEENLDKEPLEMLLDMKDTLARNEELLLQEPEVASLAWNTSSIIGLREMLMSFQSDISLDPESSNPHLILSEDLKSVKYGDVPQDLPDNKERFDVALAVLGAQTFSLGQYYWEVKVGDKTEWEVGVCKDSVRRKGQLSSLSEDLLTLESFRSGYNCFLWNSQYSIHRSQPIEKLGIFLDYDKRHIAFYDAVDGSLISNFSEIAFEGPLRPYFSLCCRKGESAPGSIMLINMGDSQ